MTGYIPTKRVVLTTKHNAKRPQEYKYMLNNVCGLTHQAPVAAVTVPCHFANLGVIIFCHHFLFYSPEIALLVVNQSENIVNSSVGLSSSKNKSDCMQCEFVHGCEYPNRHFSSQTRQQKPSNKTEKQVRKVLTKRFDGCISSTGGCCTV